MLDIQKLGSIAAFITALVAAVRFRHLEPIRRGLATLVFCEAFIELLANSLQALHRSNLFLLPADTLLEFGLLAWVYGRVLAPSAVSRALPAVVGLFAVAALLSYADPAALLRFNTGQRFAESLLVLGLVLLYFYQTLHELAVVRLEREPLFWLSVGLLVYFAGNVFIFVSGNYVLQRSTALSLRLWDIHAAFYIVLNCSYAVALWIRPSNPK